MQRTGEGCAGAGGADGAAMQGADYHAAVIQRHWRGYQVRKSLQEMQLASNMQQTVQAQQYIPAQQPQQLLQPQPQPNSSPGANPGAYPDIWNEVKGTLIRNRGVLQAAVACRRQSAEQQREHKLQAWRQFAERQARRYVPAPPNPARRDLAESTCYRLRIQRVSNLPPLTHVNGATFELQLGISLFDESLGTFYGNTCYSPPDAPQQQAAASSLEEAGGVGVDFCFDLYFHSVISDPCCTAVVEVIAIERDAAGLSTGQFSIGWAQLPLFAQQHGQMLGGQAAAAPLMSGTPRYLSFRSVCGDELPPPTVVPDCHITYQAEVFPGMNPVRPLLPQNVLVCYSDVLPGLCRFDCQGLLTTAVKGTISTLANPMLAPVVAVGLARLQLQVPQVLHNLLSVLPQLAGVMPPPDLPTLLAVPSQPGAVHYSLCLGLHNGRTFVAPQVSLGRLLVQPSLGSLVLRPEGAAAEKLQLDWLLADELVVLVLELLAAPAVGSVSQAPAVLVGRTAIAPFAEVAPNGNEAVLAAGFHKLAFSSSSSNGGCCPLNLLGGATEGLLPVNWRALLRDTAVRAVADPAVQFQLVPAGSNSSLGDAAAAAGDSLGAVRSVAQEPAVAARREQLAAEQTAAAAPVVAAVMRPAARSVMLAAKHLEEAASIPVKEVSSAGMATPSVSSGRPSRDGPGSGAAAAADTQHQQQLQQLADTMQQQIGMLARAVEDLKEERHTLRSSLTLLESAVAARDSPTRFATDQQPGSSSTAAIANNAGSAGAWRPGSPSSRPESPAFMGSNSSSIPASELERLKALKTNTGVAGDGDFAGFSGAQAAAVAAAGGQGCSGRKDGSPSRAVMQQLHEAGMAQSLPGDVQALLRRSAAAAAGSPTKAGLTQHHKPFGSTNSTNISPIVMDIEARDPRTASDVVLQLLAFRPAVSPDAVAKLPAGLASLYFTLQFYHFGPVITEPCLLAAGAGEAAGSSGVAAGAGAGWHAQQQQEGQLQQGQLPQQLAGEAGLPAQQAVAGAGATFVLLPARQAQRSGAGLVLKYQVDCSTAGQLLPGQDPAQAAFEGHMDFCSYLAKHRLALDVWDGDSLLQLGTCSIDLLGLLRQGREFSELLLEVPVLQAGIQAGIQASSPTAAAAAIPAADGIVGMGGGAGGSRQPLQLGHLVVRLINIGREPSNAAARVPDFNATEVAAGAGKKVRVRAAPLQPGSPVAKELRGGQGRSPFSIDWARQQQKGADSGDDVAAASAADIISFEQRKVAREQQLQLLNSPVHSRPGSSPGGAGGATPSPTRYTSAAGPGSLAHLGHHKDSSSPAHRAAAGLAAAAAATAEGSDPFKAVQRQLLADVDAVRKRQKQGFIRSQLRKDLVTQCTLQPCLGQVLLLEHALVNSLGRDAVFDVRISHPQELQAIESMQEYRQLQLAVGQCISTTAAAAAATAAASIVGRAGFGVPSLAQLASNGGSAAAAGQLVSKGRIFLSANERVLVPFRFKLQSQPSSAISSSSSSGGKGPSGHSSEQRVVTVEFVPAELDYPVNILELQVKPRPLIVDRTLRYHVPERSIMRVTVPLESLGSSSSTTSHPLLVAAAAGRCLAAAASRPDVSLSGPAGVVLTGQAAAAGGGGAAAAAGKGGLGEVHIKYKCGLSPEVVQFHVWLYGDASMAQPLEVWQVFVHALQKVDMRAVVGQASSTSLAVAGGTVDRQVVCYSSLPDELQPSPQLLVLPAGGICALHLAFKPKTAGKEWVRVHLVDPATKQLVHAFIVATEAALPQISRRFEVELQAGTIAQKQIVYANPYSQPRIFSVSTNVPWLLGFQPAVLELAPRGSKPLGLVIDGRAVQAGAAVQALVFVSDEEEREEECMEVVVNVL